MGSLVEAQAAFAEIALVLLRIERNFHNLDCSLNRRRRAAIPGRITLLPLPRRWAVERSFAWATRFRCLARDYERLAVTLGAFHFLACACLLFTTLFRMLAESS